MPVEIENNSMNNDAETTQYHHLLLFMIKKPLRISMIGMDVTEGNAVKFIFVFLIAKFVSIWSKIEGKVFVCVSFGL